MTIDVTTELTQALRESSQALSRLLDAAKSADGERHCEAWKNLLAAAQRKREAWLAMATPLPAGDAYKNR